LIGSVYGRKRGSLEEGDKYSGYIKCWEFLIAQELLASQDGLCSVELLWLIIKQFLSSVLIK
jgi:hypothetical protein